MEYNRYFWKSGRNQRKRTPEEMANIRKIIFAGVLSILVGIGAGAANLSILCSNFMFQRAGSGCKRIIMLIHVKSVVLSSGVAKEKPYQRQKPPSNQNEGI